MIEAIYRLRQKVRAVIRSWSETLRPSSLLAVVGTAGWTYYDLWTR
jgi:hypothetical protein